MYLVRLYADADVDIANFGVSSNTPGRLISSVWLKHYDSSPSSGSTSTSASAWLALPTSYDPSAISMISIKKHGDKAPCAPTGAFPMRLTSDNGPTTVFDDSRPHDDLSELPEPNTSLAHDSDFSGKAQPNYSDKAKEMGVMGDVTVEIEVGPSGGRPTSAWVRWADTGGSGDGVVLEDAALAAAQRSTFAPPTRDGRHRTMDYQIVYTFSLDDSDGFAPPTNPPSSATGSNTTFNGCPLEIDDARLVPHTGSDPSAWYFFTALSQFGAVTSAIVSIEDRHGHVTSYPWSAMTLSGPGGGEQFPWATAILTAQAPSVKAIWVKEATLSGGLNVDCSPDIDEPLPVADSLKPLRFIASTASLSGIVEASPARYTHQVWPSYPSEADGKRAAAHVTVDGIVDQSGHVVEAFVTHSSGLDDLDKAAMDAATASTYVAASAGAYVAFETTYRFVP